MEKEAKKAKKALKIASVDISLEKKLADNSLKKIKCKNIFYVLTL
jgi:hypothetical protein